MDVAWPAISKFQRFLALLQGLYTAVITEGLFLWAFRQGKRNEMADMEGPYYIPGAPNRNIESGKAVLAAEQDLKESIPFLFAGQVVSTSGQPIPNVVLDLWQADSFGTYYGDKYRLRGTLQTDAEGRFECLTVPPGRYGFRWLGMIRSGHIHIILSTPNKEYMTTQLYLCPGNNSTAMGSDILNFFRNPRKTNIFDAFCIPSSQGPAFVTPALPASAGSNHFLDLPSFEEHSVSVQKSGNEDAKANLETMKRSIDWWNSRLAPQGFKIGAGAYKVIKMAVKDKME